MTLSFTLLRFDQLVDDSLSDQNELKSFLRLLDAQQEEGCQCVDCHDVVQVPLDSLIELTDDSLRCIDCLEPSLVLFLLGMHQG